MSDYYWHFCQVDGQGVPRLGHGDGREARNSLKKIVDGVGGGRLRKENAAAIYLAFLRRQMEKLAERQPEIEVAAVESLPF